jgi:hypothetical protein
MNQVGLWLVKTQTIGSAVSNVTVTDAFNADYENYRIVVNGVVTTAATVYLFNFVDGSNNLVNSANYAVTGVIFQGNATVTGGYSVTDTNIQIARSHTNQASGFTFDLLSPNLAQYSAFPSISSFAGAAGQLRTAYHSLATAYPSFRLTMNTGTMTGGTIRVYGYNQ